MKKSILKRIQLLLLMVSVVSALQAQVNLTNGLVANYPFDGNANDVSTNTLNGNIQAGITNTSNRFGANNTAVNFPGATGLFQGNGVIVPNNSLLNFSGSYSISLWFKWNGNSTGINNSWDWQHLISKGRDSDNSYGVVITPSTSKLTFYQTNNSSGDNASVETVVTNGLTIWHNVIAIADVTAKTLSVYIDGQLAITNTFPNLHVSNTNANDLGMGLHNGDQGIRYPYNGALDEVKLYNRALNAAEIQALSSEGSSSAGGTTSPSMGTVLYAAAVGTADNTGFSIVTNNQSKVTITKEGAMGIGTATPDANAKLDVAGTIKASGLKLGNGTVLTSIASSPWNVNGNNINYTNGNIGIGIANPASALHVVGDIYMNKSNYAAYSSGYSSKLKFDDGDNEGSDPLWMARYNSSYNITELRVNIGDDPNDYGNSLDKFVVGVTNYVNGLWEPRMVVDASGSVGIGTSSPAQKLEVNGNIKASGIVFPDGTTITTAGLNAGLTNGGVVNFTNNQIAVGNLLPSTSSHFTDYKLSVQGKIVAKQIVADNKITWPDYVFEKDYKLKTINELDDYVRKNKHLPEIPTSEEIKDKGIDLGDMNAHLLKKLEEQSLYIIELHNRLKRLEDLLNKK